MYVGNVFCLRLLYLKLLWRLTHLSDLCSKSPSVTVGHHYIVSVVIVIFMTKREKGICWYLNHPQSCPITALLCAYHLCVQTLLVITNSEELTFKRLLAAHNMRMVCCPEDFYLLH